MTRTHDPTTASRPAPPAVTQPDAERRAPSATTGNGTDTGKTASGNRSAAGRWQH